MQKPGNFINDYRRYSESKGVEAKMVRRGGHTRWNITYGQLMDYKQIHMHYSNFVSNGLRSYNGEAQTFTDSEYTLLLDLVQLLEPCNVATKILESETYIGVSGILFVITWIRWQIEEEETDSKDIPILRIKIREKADDALEKSSYNVAFLRIASLMDPRFKDYEIMTAKQRDEARDSIMEMMQTIGESKASS